MVDVRSHLIFEILELVPERLELFDNVCRRVVCRVQLFNHALNGHMVRSIHSHGNVLPRF